MLTIEDVLRSDRVKDESARVDFNVNSISSSSIYLPLLSSSKVNKIQISKKREEAEPQGHVSVKRTCREATQAN